MKQTANVDQVVMVDPALIAVGPNARFGLQEPRIEKLMASILNLGRVTTPIKVSKLSKADDEGHQYFLHEGHYRHAAAVRLNAEQNAGVELPCLLEDQEGLERLKLQISENNDRENLSPMDKAVSIWNLLEAGVSRLEVRTMFSAPGGRKGLKLQPMSNSFLNIHLSFLELPKSIQEKIHDGRITLTGAMELVNCPPDKRAAIIESIEAERIAAIEKEEKMETKLLEEERRVTEADEKREAAAKEADAKKAEVEKAEAELAEKNKAAFEAYSTVKSAKKPEDRKKAEEHFKSLEADAKAVQKKLDAAAKEAEKAAAAADKAAKLAEEQKAKLKAKRDAKLKKAKPISSSEVQQAKKVHVPSSGHVPLKNLEIRAALTEVWKQTKYPKTSAVAKAFSDMIEGIVTPKKTIEVIAVITGELAAAAPAAAANGKKKK